MSAPATVNQTASVVNEVLKQLIEGAGQDVVEAYVIVQVPWLGWPIFRWILELILSEASALIYTQAANAATKIVIDVQVNLEKSTVISSFQNLQMAIASGDQGAIKIASQDIDNSYAALIHSDGSASP